MSKQLGQVFTPEDVVVKMLDTVGYTGEAVLHSTIMEPSFGQGVFLKEIVRRIISEGRKANLSLGDIATSIERNVHGIELDIELYAATLTELNALIEQEGLPDVTWNLIQGDAFLHTQEFKASMDFVVGNPPYVRIHNIPKEQREAVKKFIFAVGTTDLYVVFFELGLSMLAENGRLTFVTPNAFMKNTSQKKFREHLINDRLLMEVTDYRSSRVFGNTGTYAAVTYLIRDNEDTAFWYSVDGRPEERRKVPFLSVSPVIPWHFDDASGVLEKQALMSASLEDVSSIQYGVMTMRNKVYIDDKVQELGDGLVQFNGHTVESGILRPVVKGTTYNGAPIVSRIIFPYVIGDSGKYVPMREEFFAQNYPLAYAYLSSHRADLDNRDMDKGAVTWFQYGRSQGLVTVDRPKLVFKQILHPDKELKAVVVPAGTVVYAGFGIMDENDDINKLEELAAVIEDKAFIDYLKIVGKDMSGGFIAVNPKMTKAYRFDS